MGIPWAPMFNKEIKKVEGISWIGIGCVICIQASTFRLGSFHEPAPGFVAFLAGLFLCGIGIAMVLSKSFSKRQGNDPPGSAPVFRSIPWRRFTYTITLLFVYILLFDALGYILATFLLMSGLFYDWQKKNWASSFLFSILTVLISYLIFEVWLRCQLPRGVFPWW
jgi:putative tricarboxylic transport membrane protein